MTNMTATEAKLRAQLDDVNEAIAALESGGGAPAGAESFLSGFGPKALKALKKAKKILEALLTALPLLLLAADEGEDDAGDTPANA